MSYPIHRLKVIVVFIYKVNVWSCCTYDSNFSLLFSLWPTGIILKRVQQDLTNHIREKWNIQQLIQIILLKYHLILFHLRLLKDILLRFLYNPLLICLTLLHLIFQIKTLLQMKSFKVSHLKNLCTLFLKLNLINSVVILKHTSSLLVKLL